MRKQLAMIAGFSSQCIMDRVTAAHPRREVTVYPFLEDVRRFVFICLVSLQVTSSFFIAGGGGGGGGGGRRGGEGETIKS